MLRERLRQQEDLLKVLLPQLVLVQLVLVPQLVFTFQYASSHVGPKFNQGHIKHLKSSHADLGLVQPFRSQ